MSKEKGKLNYSPKNRKGQTTKGNSIFYLPKELSMTKWQTISFSCKIAEDLNSSCLRGLNWLSVFKDFFFRIRRFPFMKNQKVVYHWAPLTTIIVTTPVQ